MSDMHTLGRIRKLMKDRNISQSVLAVQAGLSESGISRILAGKQIPEPKTALAISNALLGEVSVIEILFPNGLPPAYRWVPRGIRQDV